MGKTTTKRILEILHRNGGSLTREKFSQAVMVEIGVDPRTIKRINSLLRDMEEMKLIRLYKNKISITKDGLHHVQG